MEPANAARRLKFHGALLFLIGLLTGFAVPAMTNPRMGVSAHLEGVLNGLFLVGLGMLWKELRLGPGARRATFMLALYGTWANWISTTLAASWGTSQLTPLAGAGHSGAAWQEHIVSFGLYTLSIAIVAALALAVFGLRGQAQSES
jgi:hydroxylaminobenzene mutase